MNDVYNLYNLEASFKQYLFAGNISPVSLKNYLSDFRHFIGWFTLKLRVENPTPIDSINPISLITSEYIEDYKSYLTENNIPSKTVNRRLSTVRKFCSFCISQGWLKENPAKHLTNISLTGQKGLIINEFYQDLMKENLGQQAIDDYLQDAKDFLGLIEP